MDEVSILPFALAKLITEFYPVLISNFRDIARNIYFSQQNGTVFHADFIIIIIIIIIIVVIVIIIIRSLKQRCKYF